MIRQNKKGAIELSMSTVVIIVLAMSMLILGIILIQRIFGSANEAITGIDQGVKDQINRLFAADRERTLILFPDSGLVEIERGSRNTGFAVSVRNTADTGPLPIKVRLGNIDKGSCSTNPVSASGITIIGLSNSDQTFNLGAKTSLENYIHVRFDVPQNAELCTFGVPVIATDSTGGEQQATMQISIVAD